MREEPVTLGWDPGAVGRVARMNLDQALRHAATIDDRLTVGLVERIVNDFLDQLARCPMCDESGGFVYEHDVPYRAAEGSEVRPGVVPAGAVADCPRCGPPDPSSNRSVGDREWVRWVCVFPGESCDEGTSSSEHERCGYRLILPLGISDR